MQNLINDDLELSSSDDEPDNESDKTELIMMNNLLKFKTVFS